MSEVELLEATGEIMSRSTTFHWKWEMEKGDESREKEVGL
jgi:hypothetical protein